MTRTVALYAITAPNEPGPHTVLIGHAFDPRTGDRLTIGIDHRMAASLIDALRSAPGESVAVEVERWQVLSVTPSPRRWSFIAKDTTFAH